MGRIDLSNNALSNHIAEHITEQIITGELNPGEKLIESTYAEQYGTSRAPVREAIFLLTIEGLVERIPRKGAVVKAYSETEIYDLLEIRTMLESMAMNRIAEYGVDAKILEEMKSILAKMQDGVEVDEYTQLNHSFHMGLIKSSKSDVIKKMYSKLKLPLLRIQNLSFGTEGKIQKSLKEHAIIIDMLKKNKIQEATDVLNQHNRDVILNVRNCLFQQGRLDEKKS
ncbi:GntR family transcriptional regulator [Pseudalkalibacillus salsuginis]|uniref:GntR family transcriptional regulator n=1 Tax=Pseudalkalibacillus salsuginis TaxID=2910972 RepID=UPI001F1A6C04|nr:GntR family transcriptional regulator [Pseudalkalibacillus salsuginis]MCF6409611.1 GntR family transcriptional regulator [Pseudalkalibacillus salsuginis]